MFSRSATGRRSSRHPRDTVRSEMVNPASRVLRARAALPTSDSITPPSESAPGCPSRCRVDRDASSATGSSGSRRSLSCASAARFRALRCGASLSSLTTTRQEEPEGSIRPANSRLSVLSTKGRERRTGGELLHLCIRPLLEGGHHQGLQPQNGQNRGRRCWGP
jgi:hypothetical protein